MNPWKVDMVMVDSETNDCHLSFAGFVPGHSHIKATIPCTIVPDSSDLAIAVSYRERLDFSEMPIWRRRASSD
jgi:hypothetical protein